MSTGTGRIPARQAWPRLVAAALVAGVLVLAALALQSASGQDPAPRPGPLAGHRAIVLLLSLGCAVGGGALTVHHRSSARGADAVSPVAWRLASAGTVLLPLAAVIVPITLMWLPAPPAGQDDKPKAIDPGAHQLPGPAPSQGPSQAPGPAPDRQSSTRFDLSQLLAVVGLLLVVLAIVVGAVLLWRRFGHRRREPESLDLDSTEPLTGHALADAVDEGRRALHGADVRAAVIACYAAMETSLADSGIVRRASDSPADLLQRAKATGLLSGPHALVLTALFREARYSSHPLDPGQLESARAALDAIAAQLAEHDSRTGQGTARSRTERRTGHRAGVGAR
ncbi:DUF4129 domain-containing protein [Kitasatospora sp. NPDC056138]|uniref:DUF4129 domain-containing protein n=1 Tax=Kitasatospora sp. NPDC056138 TaxID=3345724 RepID=UPI0035D59D14